MTSASLANTTSGDRVLLSFKPRVEGNQVPDEVMDEIVTRLDGEIDSEARNSPSSVEVTGQKQAFSKTLALGANELTFSWSDLFPNTSYGVCFYPTSDPGAPIRWWVSSKTTSQIIFKVFGHTAATAFTFIGTP